MISLVFKMYPAEQNHPKAAKLMHSLLYTHLIRGELLTAIDFVDHLVLRANVPASVDVDHLSVTASLESRLPVMTLVTDTLKPLVGRAIVCCYFSKLFSAVG